MAATEQDIKVWLKRAKKEKATHMLVVCDTFSWEDYPVNVLPGTDAKEKVKEYDAKSMQKVMEVYNMKMDIDKQLKQELAFNI